MIITACRSYCRFYREASYIFRGPSTEDFLIWLFLLLFYYDYNCTAHKTLHTCFIWIIRVVFFVFLSSCRRHWESLNWPMSWSSFFPSWSPKETFRVGLISAWMSCSCFWCTCTLWLKRPKRVRRRMKRRSRERSLGRWHFYSPISRPLWVLWCRGLQVRCCVDSMLE